MAIGRSEIWSWVHDVVPVFAMLMLTCLDMSLLTVVKAAMNGGLGSIAYVVYHNSLGTIILFPIFMFRMFRNTERPPLTFSILFRFFILGLFGLCLFQVPVYVGVKYTSPTLASAITNLIPGNTFLFALIFRMEKIDIRSSSSVAKLLGTVMAISGAMVFTLYQGPEIFVTNVSPNSPHDLRLLSQPSSWVFGGAIIFIAAIFRSIWNVLQSATARGYPDQNTMVFFYCLFGSMQCIALSPFLEPNPSAWALQPGVGSIAVVLGAIYSTAFHSNVQTWCLKKKGPLFVAMFSPLSIVIGVLLGVTFLGDSLHLGSAIGTVVITAGFYVVMWGQAKEKNMLVAMINEDIVVADELGPSDQNAPLLSCSNESKC
ncbi:putative EamA domain-containing protein [Helianthus debilis subsp. tardiflorus]